MYMYAFSRFKVHLHYTLKPVALELLCKRKIDLNQFTTIAAQPSTCRWGEFCQSSTHQVVVLVANGQGVKMRKGGGRGEILPNAYKFDILRTVCVYTGSRPITKRF